MEITTSLQLNRVKSKSSRVRRVRAVCGCENWSLSVSVCMLLNSFYFWTIICCLSALSLSVFLIFSPVSCLDFSTYSHSKLTLLSLCLSVCMFSSLTVRLMVVNDFSEIQRWVFPHSVCLANRKARLLIIQHLLTSKWWVLTLCLCVRYLVCQ